MRRFPGILRVKGYWYFGWKARPCTRPLVGVDSGNHIPVSGALFAVHVPGEGVIVRRFSHAGSKVLLCADQESLPPFEMSEKELEKHMVGRCLWAIREL